MLCALYGIRLLVLVVFDAESARNSDTVVFAHNTDIGVVDVCLCLQRRRFVFGGAGLHNNRNAA